MKRTIGFLAFCLFTTVLTHAQPLNHKDQFNRQDSLRGTLNQYRTWWNVLRYDISVTPDFNTRTIKGKNTITLWDSAVGPGSHTLQLDLQDPMQVDSVYFGGQPVSFKRDKNVYWIYVRDSLAKYKITPGERKLEVVFSGVPRPAYNAPWDGGWIWKKDEKGRPFISVACQGLGASVWYPCKDHQSDEPEKGASLTINVPDTLVAVGNGKLKSKTTHDGLASYTWEVNNPINNYNIIPYIGKYVNFTETYAGEKGNLSCSYWVLDYNLDKAKKQFEQVKATLKSMEYWFGPYPFYEDGFKLVEAPHLGMEHQSAVAYGNKYMNGYFGRDLSGSGWGKNWDYIIVHESGHEWFGNNITTKDIADMWVHEGFTDYSETLFIELQYGKKAADEYVQGLRKNIENDKPIIGPYGVNQEGSGDMYYKGANLIHTIRQIVNDDNKFREILRGLNKTFYHQTVTTKQIEDYINAQTGKNLSSVFDQYLRTREIPVLRMEVDGKKLKYKWDNCIDNFDMPVKLTNGQWLMATTKWQQIKIDDKNAKDLKVDPNFYIQTKMED
ncbi:M1 family metallopeptidase [Flavisolibacter tropicus]|uniref:Peptidase M1 n=1 Tax=Flavisolibacter tropicus TaxID=1492898 RepID=A0A172TRW0_9BACT|nr:M1 family metallopeptidase [Flavisolibacter tropicus]ANE49811.1 peptidase M1 [Flavisolibacter tropicus]